MLYCGLDLGKKSSHFCVMNEKKEIVREGSVANRADNLAETFGKLEPMRIVIEASGKSFWIAPVPLAAHVDHRPRGFHNRG